VGDVTVEGGDVGGDLGGEGGQIRFEGGGCCEGGVYVIKGREVFTRKQLTIRQGREAGWTYG